VRSAVLAAAAAAALVVAPAAAAHGSVRPTVAPPGAVQGFTFLIANGRDDAGMVGFSLELPAGAAVEEVTARQPEWIASSSGRRVEWRGGPIPARAFESFTLRARMPDREGSVAFVGRELFDDGPGPPFRLDVVLAGGVAGRDRRRDGRGRADAREGGALRLDRGRDPRRRRLFPRPRPLAEGARLALRSYVASSRRSTTGLSWSAVVQPPIV
jgi:hypothetical protein